jgi:hypothetical protein
MPNLQSQKELSAMRVGIAPTKERRRQNGGVIKETIKNSHKKYVSRYRAVWECPLDVYRDADLISPKEHYAGIGFRRAYYGAVISRPRDSRPVSAEEAAKEPTMYEKALDQVYNILPSDELNAVINVCGFSEHRWNPQAYEKMRKGLGHLAVQWNMAAFETCGH